MKFTNNKNIPLPIAIWLATNNYEYDTDDRVISATTLLKPLKAIHLARKYRENQKCKKSPRHKGESIGT